MRTRVLSIFFVCLAGLVVLTPETTRACSCSIEGTHISDREVAASEFAAAAVVFEGEVLRLDADGAPIKGDEIRGSTILFRVIRSYKGDRTETIQIFDPMGGSNCGFDQSAVHGKYFVYGFQGKDGKILIQTCGRTGPLASAGPDLRYARGEPAAQEDLLQPNEKWRLRNDPTLATRGATLRGKVHRIDALDLNLAALIDAQELNLASLTVWRVDENGRRENHVAATQDANRDGSYEVRFLPPGRYMVTAQASGMTADERFVGEFGGISLTEAQILEGVDVTPRSEPLGKVTIQVKAPPEFRNRIIVFLRDVQIESVGSQPYKYGNSAYLDEDGVATFRYVPYGSYNVRVLWAGDNLSNPLWTHDKVQVELSGKEADAVVTLRKNLPK
jgi:hypothetical protein